ncbi:ATP-binding protein [Parachlamydia acanthamoebae]|uniref:Schlafen AlbA-2 domain-containing protein n=2 Tax=Parachlamydia acanthamoebae TaxID=83552 RepID=F8L2G0_PARAV|nr:ATP-binding protein [Parachlamydia acanthamoebae]EFB40159.1 hypothetical protein pah_c253o013 [Parachlamydia acanthamoebae str. Hall's coccus]KIA76819.1 hypothetical protein DB43_HI00040 [Parachlamydia acanthamoebae]CCB87473.1 putative uncharacterized protein [Parachlamydia acanthamoebae UV-7]
MDILKLLNMPEGRTLEFKRDLSSLQPILKTLVAFANTAGGILIVGKENDGSVTGIKDVFEAEERLTNAISDSIYPPLMPEIDVISIEEASLLIIKVAHWLGPFYLKAKGPIKGVYVRLGSTNRVAEQELLDELNRSKSKKFFDQQPCPGTDIHDLDMEKIKKLFSGIGKEIDQQKLISLGVLVPHLKKTICSNGGVILFGKDQIREHFFPNAVVRCARFLGTEKVEFIDQYDTQGSIIEAIEEIQKFIKRNTAQGSKITQIKRKDIPEYSPIIIREVMANALVHGDYSLRGMHCRLMIYSDRMEIESPGMLPFGYTMEDFFSGVSHVRNKVIARVFRELRFIEEWGTGYKRIEAVCRKDNYPLPVWQELGLALRVIIEPHSLKDAYVLSEDLTQLTYRQEELISFFRGNKKLTAKDIYEKFNHSISERTLRAELFELKQRKFLEKIGNGRNTYWVLKNSDRRGES